MLAACGDDRDAHQLQPPLLLLADRERRRDHGVHLASRGQSIAALAALAGFDVVYLATQGGPGTQTMVPGAAVHTLAFNDSRLGAASALAVVLALIVIAVVVPLQRLFREK
ncbi:hypothetical protein ABZ725_30815 [Streptomyces sp. NPDC006872]|uniref:hypothetical protein n=1 Tax=Streptomyces sp. NPDC006872 TaxID=3155720 RepID=UPI0033EFD3F1